MAKSHWGAGGHNLNGKKFKALRCGCCTVENFKDQLIKEIIRKELTQIDYSY